MAEGAPKKGLAGLISRFRKEVAALYLALRHPQTPWYAKLLLALLVAYALSPIDLIPDFIPLIGYLDDLLILAAGVWLVLRWVPPPVMAACRAQAGLIQPPGSREELRGDAPPGAGWRWAGGALVLALWLAALYGAAALWRGRPG